MVYHERMNKWMVYQESINKWMVYKERMNKKIIHQERMNKWMVYQERMNNWMVYQERMNNWMVYQERMNKWMVYQEKIEYKGWFTRKKKNIMNGLPGKNAWINGLLGKNEYIINGLPGEDWADDEKSTQSPVSKLADWQVELERQSSIQSVSMRVPGLESSISVGAVYTWPVTSSKCTDSDPVHADSALCTAEDRRIRRRYGILPVMVGFTPGLV